jgi:2-C-methyl-D-erythritol 4-phosphate cytidylyltransferase
LAVGGDPAIVLIHDAARPWASPDLARRVAKAAREHGAALPLVPSRDTLKEADPSGMVAAHLKRSRVMAAQTPQGFDFWRILRAHRAAEEAIVAGEVDDAFTDDTEVWAAFGEGAVAWVEGEETNLKITYAGDL